MIHNNIEYIKHITKELGLNHGKGFSKAYIQRVLNDDDKRTRKEIELIAQCIETASDQLKEILINNLTKIEDGKAFWIRISNQPLTKSNQDQNANRVGQ